MKITIQHSTVYRYSSAVSLDVQTIRLRPRSDGSQLLREANLQIEPNPELTAECLDQEGNSIVKAWFTKPTDRFSLTSRTVVETKRENPFDFIPVHSSLAVNLYDSELRRFLSPYIDSPISEQVRVLALGISQSVKVQTLDFLTALTNHIHNNFRQTIRQEGAAYAADVTLRSREGTCRDLAVLFCDAARSVGLAARFASGYEHQSAQTEGGDMHAWAEVYFAEGGWRGYDPSRGLAVTTSHVATAASFLPELASPVSGTYHGSATSHMHSTLTVDLA